MSCNLFAEAKAKFKSPPGPEIEDYMVKQDYEVAKVAHQVAKDQVQKEWDNWMDHECVVEAEKASAAARAAAAVHTEAEATKDKKKKCRLGDVTQSCAEEVTISVTSILS